MRIHEIVGSLSSIKICEGGESEFEGLRFNPVHQKIFDRALSRGLIYIRKQMVEYRPVGQPNRCETNVFNIIRQNPKRYYPVGGYSIFRGTIFVEHWWVYDLEKGSYVEITPMKDIGELNGYIGIINKEINDEIVAAPKFAYAPRFLKGGYLWSAYFDIDAELFPPKDEDEQRELTLHREKKARERKISNSYAEFNRFFRFGGDDEGYMVSLTPSDEIKKINPYIEIEYALISDLFTAKKKIDEYIRLHPDIAKYIELNSEQIYRWPEYGLCKKPYVLDEYS